MKETNFVAVRTMWDADAAHIIRNALLDQGIECVLDGEYQGGLTNVQLIHIRVPEEKQAEADAYLSEHHSE
jgi:hypothetical protein